MKGAPGEEGANERSTGSGAGGGGATVWDVAARAGVSAMTVSRVINGNPSVSARNREKVLRAIDDLHYQVNVAARAARIGTLRVGLLYSNPSAAFLSALLVGALGECGRTGAHLLLEHCEIGRAHV